ncbi:hypothetical protein GN278_08840 [Rhodobacteraceae bacterium Araon29]
MTSAQLYSMTQTNSRNKMDWTDLGAVPLKRVYTAMTTYDNYGTEMLIGYDSASGTCDTYELLDKAPWVKEVANIFDFGKGWDSIQPFYMMNHPHILAYQAKNGHMYFFPLTKSLHSEHPLHFYHLRYPYTNNLSEVRCLNSLGQNFVLGYNTEDGAVNIWTISATATSTGKSPPLVVESVWAHQWAKGWTRFAFFTWGAESFFLKTNTWKPNVNIDHVWNDLSAGTNEVGSHLKLKDDQTLNIVRPFMVGSGDPYFLTYLSATGEVRLNRVHGDCMGWTTEATERAFANAETILTYRLGDQNYGLFV